VSTYEPEDAGGIARKYLPDDATDSEITELLDRYVKDGARNLGAVVTHRCQNGQIRRDLKELRESKRKTEVRDWLETVKSKAPPCSHGEPGGDLPRPDNGLPHCARCRKSARRQKAAQPGTDAVAEQTDPAPVAVADRRVILTKASQIKPRPVWWMWEDRMPVGHISLVPGREGIGKSLFLIDLTAQITRGTLAGAYYGAPRPVIYCATEDSWQHTIVPRLMAARADLDLVYQINVESIEISTGASVRVELTMPRDCDMVNAEIKRLGVAMMALDPLISVIDHRVDTYNDREMRTVLEPLGRLADETGCTIIGLAHFNKSGDVDPLNLVTGSRAFTAYVRSVIAIARDDENSCCVVSQVKNNLGRLDLPNLTYVIQSATIETDEGACKVGRLQFTGESAKSVGDILAETSAAAALDRTERAECADWLRQVLADAPQRSRDVDAEAQARGFSNRTLKRARKHLGVKAEQLATGNGGRNEWWLQLPAEAGGPEGG
jgi:hypothetical protein